MDVPPAAPFDAQLATLLRARFPILYVPTWEEDRAVEAIARVAADERLVRTPRAVVVWSATAGLVGPGLPGRTDSRSPVRALEVVERHDEAAVFVLKDLHVALGGHGRQPDAQVVRMLRDLATTLKRSAKPKAIVLLSPTLVLPVDLQKDVTILDFGLPTWEEMETLLREMTAANAVAGKIRDELGPEDRERLAKTALGLTLQEAENAFARAMVRDGRISIDDLGVILEEKRQIVQKSGVLEYIGSEYAIEDVGGLENLKRWLRRRDKAWLAAASRYGLAAPKGVLITGVPGCGKSLVAKAVSGMWQLPLLRLDVGRVFSGVVGSSEDNMRQAIRIAEAIAPCVLWIDEIEKGFASIGTNGDSGTSARVFATFLTWMQEKRKPVFVVATANNIATLPAEMLRKGRFDEIFFVDLPTRPERAEIFRLHLERRLTDAAVRGGLRVDASFLDHLAGLTEGFTGAEIEGIVTAALFEAFHGDRALDASDLVEAIAETVPLSATQAEQIRAIRDWATLRAVAATPHADRSGYAQAGGLAASGGSVVPDDVRGARGGRTVDF